MLFFHRDATVVVYGLNLLEHRGVINGDLKFVGVYVAFWYNM